LLKIRTGCFGVLVFYQRGLERLREGKRGLL
jgi:hypothetical protein